MYSVKLIHFSMRKNIMDFDRLKKFVEHKSSPISNYDMIESLSKGTMPESWESSIKFS